MNTVKDEFKSWLETPKGTIILNRDFGHKIQPKIDGIHKISHPDLIAEFESFCRYKGIKIISIEGKSGEYRATIAGNEWEKTIFIDFTI